MKLRFWDRIVSAVMGLMLAAMSVGMALYAIGLLPRRLVDRAVSISANLSGWKLWVVVALCMLLFLLGLRGVSVLFRRRREKGFVMQHMEYGDMNISMKALENLIRRCVNEHDEMKLNNILIHRLRSGIGVDLRITLRGDTNIPIAVGGLQKQIKEYITSFSGIEVEEVRVQVETEIAHLPAPEPVAQPALDAPAEEPEKAPRKRLWGRREEKREPVEEKTAEMETAAVAEEPVAAMPVEEPAPAPEKGIEANAVEATAEEAAEVDFETDETAQEFQSIVSMLDDVEKANGEADA